MLILCFLSDDLQQTKVSEVFTQQEEADTLHCLTAGGVRRNVLFLMPASL